MDAANLPFRIPDSWPPERRIAYLDGLVRLGLDDGQVCRTANIIADQFSDFSGTDRDLRVGDAILHYVQTKVPYVPDPSDEEWYQGPVYTLAYGGDCEDLAVLVAALARCAGLTSDVYWIEQPAARLNHVVSRIKIGGAYLFADASITTAFLGEHPHDAVKRSQQQFERLGLHNPRSQSVMSSFSMPTDTAHRPTGSSYRSAGQSTEATPPAAPPGAQRPEHGYDPTSADYLREKRIKKAMAVKVAAGLFALGVAVGVGRKVMG